MSVANPLGQKIGQLSDAGSAGAGTVPLVAVSATRVLRNGDHLSRLFVAGALVASIAFFTVVVRISNDDPDYFTQRLVAKLDRNVDPIITGSTSKKSPPAMPVPLIERGAPTPQDYQVVSIYEGEATLATLEELFHVRVGSSLPGLGTITAIVPTKGGGRIATQAAVLTMSGG
ncbi:hypothetical protein NPA31_005825 [Aurantimonas sp. MSK8Z-1]|uniref:hypothetical protein n=1 Tax=Mangrovibrevibacter kandeliae TaxID=2968473 RepID=UPI0021184834|nr:hypothetical protein [Aurantimonas sp. MSK8Z-1]MCW4114479.1 hypothetical protein [Aurantimonas sp. MSK8Z-1]